MDLQDKRALTTGGTSAMGSVVAVAMTEKGASVVITGRDETRGASTTEQIRAGRHEAHGLSERLREGAERIAGLALTALVVVLHTEKVRDLAVSGAPDAPPVAGGQTRGAVTPFAWQEQPGERDRSRREATASDRPRRTAKHRGQPRPALRNRRASQA